MADIKTGGYTIQVPGVSSERVSRIGVSDRQVRTARPQRAFEGEGGYLLARGLKNFGESMAGVGEAIMKHEAGMMQTKVDDAALEAFERFSDRYANEIAPLQGKDAEKIFEQEVETVQMSRDSFLEKAGDNRRLRDLMAQAYDLEARKYLNKVLAHKLTQDANYRKEVQIGTAYAIQGEMSTYNITEFNNVMHSSRELEAKIDDPILKLGAKLAGWRGWFKYNAKKDPYTTQALYDQPKIRKEIIKEIGTEGLDSIQAEINAGKEIYEHSIRWRKYQEDVATQKKDEKYLTDIFHRVVNPDQFNLAELPNYIDKLDMSPQLKIAALGLVSRVSKSNDTTPTNIAEYALISEHVNNYRDYDMTIPQVMEEVIKATGKSFNTNIARGLIDRITNRNVYDNPIVKNTFKELEQYYLDGDLEPVEYFQALHDFDTILRKNGGNPDATLKYVNDVLNPRIKTNGFYKLFNKWGILKDVPTFQFRESPIGPYMSDAEEETANEYLKKKGKTYTIDKLDPDLQLNILTYIRSEGYNP